MRAVSASRNSDDNSLRMRNHYCEKESTVKFIRASEDSFRIMSIEQDQAWGIIDASAYSAKLEGVAKDLTSNNQVWKLQINSIAQQANRQFVMINKENDKYLYSGYGQHGLGGEIKCQRIFNSPNSLNFFTIEVVTLPEKYDSELASNEAGFKVKSLADLRDDVSYCVRNEYSGRVWTFRDRTSPNNYVLNGGYACGPVSAVKIARSGEETDLFRFTSLEREQNLWVDVGTNYFYNLETKAADTTSQGQIWKIFTKTKEHSDLGLFQVRSVANAGNVEMGTGYLHDNVKTWKTEKNQFRQSFSLQVMPQYVYQPVPVAAEPTEKEMKADDFQPKKLAHIRSDVLYCIQSRHNARSISSTKKEEEDSNIHLSGFGCDNRNLFRFSKIDGTENLFNITSNEKDKNWQFETGLFKKISLVDKNESAADQKWKLQFFNGDAEEKGFFSFVSAVENKAVNHIGLHFLAQNSLKSLDVSDSLGQQFRLTATTPPSTYIEELTSSQPGYIVRDVNELKAEVTYCLVNVDNGDSIIHNPKGTLSIKPTGRQFGCGENSKIRMQQTGAPEDSTFVIWFPEINRALDLDSTKNTTEFGDFAEGEEPAETQIWNLFFENDANKALGLFHVMNVSRGRWLMVAHSLGERDSEVAIYFSKNDFESQKFMFMVTDSGSV